MFPGRFPNVPDTMWNFGWSPQPMGLQGQFCGGDMMNQQSQAQSQAQTQAQLAALREQNTILKQQLASQAQSHIQHLQQLLPFHQSTPQPHTTSTPPTPQPTPQASEPPTPMAPPSTQTGSSDPSILKRWCNRWSKQLNPVSRPLWTRLKSEARATFHHLHIHQFQPFHTL